MWGTGTYNRLRQSDFTLSFQRMLSHKTRAQAPGNRMDGDADDGAGYLLRGLQV